MISKAEALEFINDLFKKEALEIGDSAAAHRLDDDHVWRLMGNLDVIRSRVLRRVEAWYGDDTGRAPRPNLKQHPAIEDFLLNIRRAQQ